jgi:hypothetical protein
LALLQEEAVLDSYGKELKKQNYISSSRKYSAEGSKPAVILPNSPVRIMTPSVDERKLNELNKPRTTDDKLSVFQMWRKVESNSQMSYICCPPCYGGSVAAVTPQVFITN